MSRHTNSHIYCPQQIRAMSACFGLTQGDLESEYDTWYPFFSSLSFLLFDFSNWLASDVRMRSDRYHEIFVQKNSIFYDTATSSIAVAHRRYSQQDSYYSVHHRLIPVKHETAFSRRSLYSIILSSINCWRKRCCIDQQQQQSVASAILATTQQSVRNTTTLIITPTVRSASTFRLWG